MLITALTGLACPPVHLSGNLISCQLSSLFNRCVTKLEVGLYLQLWIRPACDPLQGWCISKNDNPVFDAKQQRVPRGSWPTLAQTPRSQLALSCNVKLFHQESWDL
jgi:hypothetical protein